MNVYDAKHITIPEGAVKRILDSNDNVIWQDINSTPFYIENIGNVSDTIKFEKLDTMGESLTIEYSKDCYTWETLGETAYYNQVTKTLNSGEKIYIRTKPSRYWYEGSGRGNKIYAPNPQSSFRIGGNIMSLVYGGDFTGNERTFRSVYEVPGYTSGWLMSIFEGWTNLIDASQLLLIANHEHDCYRTMFAGCTGLKNAPLIIDGNVANYSCTYMFKDCTSLIDTPSLPATVLANSCYYRMFSGCTALTIAPELPATTLVSSCYESMFRDCTNLNTIRCNAKDISAAGCVSNWVNGVAASGTFYKNPDMSSWPTGRDGIPANWTVQDL